MIHDKKSLIELIEHYRERNIILQRENQQLKKSLEQVFEE